MRKAGFLLFIIIFISQMHFADELKIIDSLKRNLIEVNNQGRIENYLLIAENYRIVDVDSTIKYGILAIERASELGDKEREAFSQRSLGVSYFYISDLKSAMDYFRQSLKTYQSINHNLGVSNCYNGIGLVFELSLKLDSAEFYLNKSLQIRLDLNDLEQVAASYVNIGNLYYYKNQLTIALEYYLKALKITIELDITDDIGDAYINLGIIYNELNQFDIALDYYEKADSIFICINNVRSLSKVLLNEADIYNFHFNNYAKSLQLYKESLAIKVKLNEKSGIALIYNNISVVYGNMENYKLALNYLEKAKRLYTEIDSQLGLIMVDYNFGNAYLALNWNIKAIKYFLASLNNAKKAGFNDYVALNNEGLIKAYAVNGDYKNFEKYFNLNKNITDSLLSNLNQAQLSKVETDFLANELSEENEVLKDRATELNQIAKTRLFVIIGLSVLLLIGILFQIVYYLVLKKSN